MPDRYRSPPFFENREQNGIETAGKRPNFLHAPDAVAHAEPPGTPRGAGKAQKRQSQPRTVGFEFWWAGAESNHRHTHGIALFGFVRAVNAIEVIANALGMTVYDLFDAVKVHKAKG